MTFGQKRLARFAGRLPGLAEQIARKPGIRQRGAAFLAVGQVALQFGVWRAAEVILESRFELSASHRNIRFVKHLFHSFAA